MCIKIMMKKVVIIIILVLLFVVFLGGYSQIVEGKSFFMPSVGADILHTGIKSLLRLY